MKSEDHLWSDYTYRFLFTKSHPEARIIMVRVINPRVVLLVYIYIFSILGADA